MPRPAQTKAERDKLKCEEYLDCLDAALSEIHGLQAEGKSYDVVAIAAKHGASKSTVYRHLQGNAMTIDEFNKTKQCLLPSAEDELVAWCLEYESRNLPLSNEALEERANDILKAMDPDSKPVGVAWITRFINRHKDKITHQKTHPLERVRAISATRAAIDAYFAHYTSIVGELGEKIDPSLQFAFDETGLQPAIYHSRSVVGRTGSKGAHVTTSSNRINTTFVPVISADGKLVMSLMIFKGTYLKAGCTGKNGNPFNILYVTFSSPLLLLNPFQPCCFRERICQPNSWVEVP